MTNNMRQKFLQVLWIVLSLVSFNIPQVAWSQDDSQLRQVYQRLIDSFDADLAEARRGDLGDSAREIQVFQGAGIAHQYFGNYSKALELLEEALERSLQTQAYPMVGSLLYQMSSVHSKLGDYLGIQFLESHLEIAKARGDRQYQREVLKYLALAHMSSVQYQKAIPIYEEYLALVRSFNDVAEEVATLGYLASAYGTLGEREKLQATLNQQLAVARASGNPELEKMALSYQSSWAVVGQDSQAAIQAQEQALQLARTSGDIYQELSSLQQLAQYQATAENIPNVISRLEELLSVARQRLNPETIGLWEAQALEYLGQTYAHIRDYNRAIELFQQSLAIYTESDRQATQTNRLSALESLAKAQFQAGQLAQAAVTLQKAIEVHEIRRQNLDRFINLFALSRDDLQLSLRETLSDLYRLQQQIFIRENRPQDALVSSETGRARAFVDLLTMNLAVDPQTPINAPEPTLAELSAIARGQNSTLVQYSVILDRPRFPVMRFGKQSPREILLYIWVIQPNGEIAFRSVDLQPFWQKIDAQGDEVSNLGDLVIAARESIGAGGRGITFNEDTTAVARALAQIQRNDQKNQQLQQLHEVLIQPIADLLPQNPEARVTFIPQDSLFLVPFPALLDAEGKHLIEKHTLLTSPSIQVLELTQRQRQRIGTPSKQALVVGNPTMPSLRFKVDGPLVQLSSLPGAEREARAIAQMLNTQPLMGAAATEAAVVERLPQAGIIHLATHGLLDNLMGFQSSLAFTPAGKSDGFLTAREIIQLRLNANLVVLSACDTGRGRISGDGVIGLSRSFIAAGVPSVIVSLWKVPDEPTSALMQAFYQNLQQDSDKAKALRNAMLSTMKQYPDPKDWAAFTLIGEAD
ncbi:CHAT domain-containing protein [Geitlerinema calcuttense]|nr:CHAT domain-containing tetratricopeptide repeat protein [Geitlerinema calcuttense]